MKLLVIAVFVSCACHLSFASQLDADGQLRQAFDFQNLGHYDRVVELLSPIVQSGPLPATLEGQTLTVLGFAYEALGRFDKAQTSYEQAILVLGHDRQHSDDYGLALVNFANLLGEEGRSADAPNLDKQAVRFQQKSQRGRPRPRVYCTRKQRTLATPPSHLCSIPLTFRESWGGFQRQVGR